MDPAPNPKATAPDDVLVARADQRLAHAYDQIARADEQLARLTEQLSKLESDNARRPSAAPVRRQSRGRPVLRGLVGLLLAACILAAAFVFQSSRGDAARLTVARWARQLLPVSALRAEKPKLPDAPSPPVARLAAAETTPVQPAPPAQIAPQDVVAPAPAPAPLPPELSDLLHSMARDLANLQQGIEQLRARQEQMASDNAMLAMRLKAGQEQVTSLLTRVSEQNKPSERPRTLAPAPRPAVAPARKPVPTGLSH